MVLAIPWSFFPAEWAPAPWAATVFSLLIGASLALDVSLARRYAGGRESRDGALWAFLSVSLISNLVLAIVLSGLGIGRIPWHPESVAAFGGLLGVAGLALRYWAIAALGRHFTWRVTILEDHELMTAGLFGVLRHPSYTGGLLAAVGMFLALANWVSLVVFCLTHVPLVVWRIAIEERVLEQYFRERYVAYRDKTRALVPFVF